MISSIIEVKVLRIKTKKDVIGFKDVKDKHLLFFGGGNIANVSSWMYMHDLKLP